MISYLKKLFKNFYHPNIKMLGRAGIIYKYDKTTYYVDSEGLTGNPDIVIYADKIWDSENKERPISDQLKYFIAEKVKIELESMGISAEISTI